MNFGISGKSRGALLGARSLTAEARVGPRHQTGTSCEDQAVEPKTAARLPHCGLAIPIVEYLSASRAWTTAFLPSRSNTELQGRMAPASHNTRRKSLHSIRHTTVGLGRRGRPKTGKYH